MRFLGVKLSQHPRRTQHRFHTNQTIRRFSRQPRSTRPHDRVASENFPRARGVPPRELVVAHQHHVEILQLPRVVAHPAPFASFTEPVSFKLMTRRPLRAVDVRASAVFPFAALSRRHVVFAQFAPVDVTRRERLGGRPNRSHGDERAIVDVDVARGVGSRRHRRWARAGEKWR